MSSLVIKLARTEEADSAGNPGKEAREIERLLGKFGVVLDEAKKSALRNSDYLQIEGVTPERLDDLRNSLHRLPNVEAAYIKPADEIP